MLLAMGRWTKGVALAENDEKTYCILVGDRLKGDNIFPREAASIFGALSQHACKIDQSDLSKLHENS
jgi:hypothetical protein